MIPDLENGQEIFVVVRAVDETAEGLPGNEDDNELEWSAIPNPVLYVQAESASPGDGRTKDAPLPTLDAAIDAAIPLGGANIHVAAGEYEESTLLFRGMMVYGGFERGFTSPFSDPVNNRTVIRAGVEENLFVIPPGSLLCGIDGVEMDGRGRTLRGVAADECAFRISNCEIHGFKDKGIKLKSGSDPTAVIVGEVARCWIHHNGNQGIQMNGILDVQVVGCAINDNGRQGIEVESLTASPEEKSRIVIEGCTIAANHDVGIAGKIVALPDKGSSGSRIRLKVRSCEIRDNRDTGIGVDVVYPDGLIIDLRIRIEQCRVIGNGKSGIRLDGDARGHLQLTRNLVLGNRGPAGIHLTGDGAVSYYQVQSSAVLANDGAGILMDARGHLGVDHCHFAGNGGAAIDRRGLAWVRLEDSLFHDNGIPSAADRIDDCIASPNELAGPSAPEGIAGSPWLDTLPRQIIRLSNSTMLPADLAAGTVVEWLDDGIARRVIVEGERRTLDPPIPPFESPGVPFLFVWERRGGESVGEVSVVEDWRPPPGSDSPLLDAGNVLEIEADGSRADVGPAGAFFGGHPGLDRGGPPPPRGLELSWIDPPPGSWIGTPVWEVWFTGGDEIPPGLRVVLEVDGVPLVPGLEPELRSLTIRANFKIPLGAKISVKFPPWPNKRGERPQPQDNAFEYRMAHEIDPAGITALPVEGRLSFPGRATIQIPLQVRSEGKMRIRLIPLDPPWSPGWRLRIVDRASGVLLRIPGTDQKLETAAGEHHEGALLLEVPPLTSGLEPVLEIVPPPGELYIEDAAARLLIEG